MTDAPAIEKTLAHAETVVRARGGSLTPIRREVLSQLVEARRPVGAYALLDQIKRPKGRMMPATVYRALDFLMAQGLVHRIETMNAFVACAELDHVHDHAAIHGGQFLICTQCGQTLELDERPAVKQLRRAGEGFGFEVTHLTIEMRGLCETCRNGGVVPS